MRLNAAFHTVTLGEGEDNPGDFEAVITTTDTEIIATITPVNGKTHYGIEQVDPNNNNAHIAEFTREEQWNGMDNPWVVTWPGWNPGTTVKVRAFADD